MRDAGKEDKEFEEGCRRLEEGNKLKQMMSQHARGVGRLLGTQLEKEVALISKLFIN